MSTCRCLLLRNRIIITQFRQIYTTTSLPYSSKLATAKKKSHQDSIGEVEIKYTNENLAKYVNSNEDLKKAIVNDEIKSTLVRVLKNEPTAMFCVSTATAKKIVDTIYPMINPDIPLLEVNPGPGFVTRELLKVHKKKLFLHDMTTLQENTLADLQKQYPEQVKYVKNDFFFIYKLAFLDRMDKGARMEAILKDYKKINNSNDPSFQIFGSITSMMFFRHLIMSTVFQTNFMSLTKPHFYAIISPKLYYTYHSPEGNSDNIYKAIPVLFNILFDMERIDKLPKKDFLPWFKEKLPGKGKFLIDVIQEEKHWLYLVRLTPKNNLPCSAEQLPMLWYFLKHHLRNKTNRIIPNLEQWIPGCGIWLITDQDPPGTESSITENDVPLPHMNIFTRFSDLMPEQTVTLFKKFISWPEFQQSSFADSLDHELTKLFSKDSENEDAFIQEDPEETSESEVH